MVRRSRPAEVALKIDEALGEESFKDLNALFVEHPEVSDMHTSPTGEQLDAFHLQLIASPYVQGLFSYGKLRLVLNTLEAGFQQWFLQNSAVQAREESLKRQKTKEREVRFIMRLAAILGPANRRIEVYVGAEQRGRLTSLVESLSNARPKLGYLLADEHFRESLASNTRVKTLEQLERDMVKALAWLRGADQFMDYPIDRAPKANAEDTTETTRQLGNRIADAAFRIYANCDESILLNTLSFGWLPTISKAQRVALIEGALQRKIGQYERRIPNEEYAGADLFGSWIVGRDIDPPWMVA